ncbi:helix-turn-helix domain-containing protein [Pseudonocardia eucalypti]|uniref:Helix-turn-helix domain-containing protein n=1 Tax=Pseudonocardia eucalypti TaxID=648755 RepID=A0ABP9Q765_9PSEU
MALVGRLRDDADVLVAEFTARVRAIGPYRRGVVPTERLVADADLTFQYLLRRLAGRPVPDWLDGIGPAIGRDRARRGVPLNDLLTAVRLDFRVLWAALRERAAPADEPLLVARVESVWQAVEEYTTQIQLAYQAEAALLARERQGERTMLVAALLSSADPSPEQIATVAVALGVDTRDSLLVAAARNDPGEGGRRLRQAADRLGADGRPVHVQSTGPHSVLLARWEGGVGAPVRAALAGVPCGVGPIARGLAALPRCARLACEIVDLFGDPEPDPGAAAGGEPGRDGRPGLDGRVGLDGPVELADSWVPLAAARLADARGDLVDSVLGGLAEISDSERARLLETVRHYAARGVIGEVATRMYCHRNTVLNRLRRFADLTAHDPTVPAEAATILLALRAASQP